MENTVNYAEPRSSTCAVVNRKFEFHASDPILLLVSNSISENSEQQIARPISI